MYRPILGSTLGYASSSATRPASHGPCFAALFRRPLCADLPFCKDKSGLTFGRENSSISTQIAKKIDQILAFGIPWAGTLKAVRFLGKGEAFGLIIFGNDLFPADPGKTQMQGEDGKNLNLFVNGSGKQIGPLVDTSWIPSGPAKDFMRDMAKSADQRLGAVRLRRRRRR